MDKPSLHCLVAEEGVICIMGLPKWLPLNFGLHVFRIWQPPWAKRRWEETAMRASYLWTFVLNFGLHAFSMRQIPWAVSAFVKK